MFPGYPSPAVSVSSSSVAGGGVCCFSGVTLILMTPESFGSPSLSISSTGISALALAFSPPTTVTLPVFGSIVRSISSFLSFGVPPSNLTRVSSSLTRSNPGGKSLWKRKISSFPLVTESEIFGSPDSLVRCSPESFAPMAISSSGYCSPWPGVCAPASES